MSSTATSRAAVAHGAIREDEMQPREVYLTARQVRERYGGRSDMWLFRLKDDPRFPKPIKLRGLRYWRLTDLVRWEREEQEAADAA